MVWPETDAGLPEDLLLYHSLRDELTYHECSVVKGNRVIVPGVLRERILHRLQSPSEYVKKVLAQERVYWYKMYRSIESFVLRCKACQEVGPRCNLIEPLQPLPIPGQPWSKLGSDSFYLKGEFYLILIDYCSNVPIIRNMVTSSTKEAHVVLNPIFSEYRLPSELVTDHRPCYTATEFKEFCQSRFVKHTLCSAFHHSSNGCTEKAIQENNKIFYKCKSEGSSPNLALLQHSTTPKTPGEICYLTSR